MAEWFISLLCSVVMDIVLEVVLDLRQIVITSLGD